MLSIFCCDSEQEVLIYCYKKGMVNYMRGVAGQMCIFPLPRKNMSAKFRIVHS